MSITNQTQTTLDIDTLILGDNAFFGVNHRSRISGGQKAKKFADTKIKNFSAGMQMRLAFATAIQVNPDILVLDEVFAVGDIDFQKKCYDAIMSFKEQGKSIIFVSHDMGAIRKHCDRVVFLNKGKVVAIGKPDEVTKLYEDYSKSHSGNQVNI